MCDGTHSITTKRKSTSSLLMNGVEWVIWPSIRSSIVVHENAIKILSIFICGFRWVDWKTTSTASMTSASFRICIRLCGAHVYNCLYEQHDRPLNFSKLQFFFSCFYFSYFYQIITLISALFFVRFFVSVDFSRRTFSQNQFPLMTWYWQDDEYDVNFLFKW